MPDHLYVGLMSGTSADGIDAALVRCRPGGEDSVELLATRALPLADALKAEIAALSHTGPNEIERLGVLDRELGEGSYEQCFACRHPVSADEMASPSRMR